MRQTKTKTSTYSADVFGVCSALYELGGMTVMHDASGCNSTYTTHDEPRWYKSDSLVFISGLTEMDAVMGNDAKVTEDMLNAIKEFKPKFAAVAGTPIPMMSGCDLKAIASEVEQKSGIPCFFFDTNGMRSYNCGVSEALAAFASRMTLPDIPRIPGTVNIIGATPLDFGNSETLASIKAFLSQNGWKVISTWAMGSTLEDLAQAGSAEVNLVISSTGIKAAQVLKAKFNTPYTVGLPIGEELSRRIVSDLKASAEDSIDRVSCADFFSSSAAESSKRILIIGENVISSSLAFSLKTRGITRVLCPLDILPKMPESLSSSVITTDSEEDIEKYINESDIVIADPLYAPLIHSECRLIPLPHIACSGRMFIKDIPDLTKINLQNL